LPVCWDHEKHQFILQGAPDIGAGNHILFGGYYNISIYIKQNVLKNWQESRAAMNVQDTIPSPHITGDNEKILLHNVV
jgi:hypothetical protein